MPDLVVQKVRKFSVCDSILADRLWKMLHELGIKDSNEDRRPPEVEFITSLEVVTAPKALRILLVTEHRSEFAFHAEQSGNVEESIFVDAGGPSRETYMRCLGRLLFYDKRVSLTGLEKLVWAEISNSERALTIPDIIIGLKGTAEKDPEIIDVKKAIRKLVRHKALQNARLTSYVAVVRS
jgi:hypothetical protein